MKTIAWTIIIAAIGVLSSSLLGQEKKPAIEIRKIVPADSAIHEEWERVTAEVEILGVDAARVEQAGWNWQVFIYVAEFVRKDPLASRLQDRITSALKRVKGVKAVAREDTEVWLVRGQASGEELVRSCSIELDQLAPDLRKYLETLEEESKNRPRQDPARLPPARPDPSGSPPSPSSGAPRL